MRNELVFLLVIICIMTVRIDEASALFKSTKFTVVAVDEQGDPVTGVKVGVGFERNTGWSTDSSGQQGITDANGELIFSGQSNGHITYGGRKDGYYDSYYDYDFKDLKAFGWEPWNPEFKIVMRKIETPVPMYARNTTYAVVEIPVVGKDVGFDLIASDWLIPYGKGTTADLVFRLERRVVNRTDFDATLTIRFSGKYDGIQPYREIRQYGSQFHLPRFAPQDGYQSSLVLHEWRNSTDSSVKRNFNFFAQDTNYIFRVRSEEKDHQLVRAMYGKIGGTISFDPVFSKTSSIHFKYYLNPDYTRNLEFDPKRNLFGKLPDRERVTEP